MHLLPAIWQSFLLGGRGPSSSSPAADLMLREAVNRCSLRETLLPRSTLPLYHC